MSVHCTALYSTVLPYLRRVEGTVQCGTVLQSVRCCPLPIRPPKSPNPADASPLRDKGPRRMGPGETPARCEPTKPFSVGHSFFCSLLTLPYSTVQYHSIRSRLGDACYPRCLGWLRIRGTQVADHKQKERELEREQPTNSAFPSSSELTRR